MREINVKLYKFKELPENIRELVLKTWYDDETYPWLTTDIEEYIRQHEYNFFFSDFKVQYSLSWSQGDGLCIDGEIDVDTALRKLFPKMPKKKRERFRDEHNIYTRNSVGYYYAAKWQVHCDAMEQDKEFMDTYYPAIAKAYLDLCHDAEKFGYDILEYRMGEDEFAEICENNGYEFFESGKMYTGGPL